MSMRALINFRIIASVIVILIFSIIIAVWQARVSVEKEVRSSINLAVQMIEFGFDHLSTGSEQKHAWFEKIATMQPARHLNISIENTKRSTVKGESHYQNPEENAAPRWFIKSVMADFLTHNYDMEIADGSVETIFITADPMDEINEAWGETKVFFGSIALMLSVIFFTVNLVFNSMLKAVKAILSGLRQVETGHFDLQLPHFKISEFNTIAMEINGMSRALKNAQTNNQALALHSMKIQETERQNMSRELHDEMGQSLTAIKAMAVTCQQPKTDVKAITDSIIKICDHLSVVVRSMMKTLHPLSLSELGLGATLSELVTEWQRRNETLCFDLEYDPSLESLSDEIAIHVYRIVQECLTNVVRHANASKVEVLINKDADQVKITVTDDGQGKQFNPAGFGLLGMRERAENLGGQFHIESIENYGVKVTVELPYWEDK
ncbi:sensor histidine kinase [Aliiglaciecola sp. NS0011-25]|uniref:sensor histidine kinase n=1 Tax=Aliiglaciecola sp. NS0011-25 TaxID=3127654 RepID=UPI003103794F